MKVATPNTVRLHQAAAKTPGSEYAFWADSRPVTQDHQNAPGLHFTPRQLEVLALLCEGLPNKLICRRLNIATGTVKVHISCILRELGVASRLQAVVAAGSLGITGERTAAALEEETAGAAGQPVKVAPYPAGLLDGQRSWQWESHLEGNMVAILSPGAGCSRQS